ncbi:TRAP-type C4-dicarboxylate transport system, small permease component [Salipiger thiooxidans]|uniref:TRAP transporter small permease protein n=1 Tax=Salipiger thiooxidans TaxID=282683 RepID=A0A1G7FDV9_9RHOB|nr:TRAP transporter small permease subunit [Salipiger thiooxidans]SDE74034.1 TRAP-type C4-dicarboxylate transport system, small permease component [Salipiger thiooxidans]
MRSLALFLDRLSLGVDRVLRLIALVCLVLMVCFIVLQVVARYGFAAPPAWTEEAARYAMVWVGLLGASISFRAGFDPKLVKLPATFPRPILALGALLRGAAVLVFLGPILFYCFYGPGLNPARSFLTRNLYTTAETFDMATIFVAITVPIFIIAIFLHGIARCACALASMQSDDQPREPNAQDHA